jgi:hypothetical protein
MAAWGHVRILVSYCYICVLILLYMCPHPRHIYRRMRTLHILQYEDNRSLDILCMCPHTAICTRPIPHTTIYNYYICADICFYYYYWYWRISQLIAQVVVLSCEVKELRRRLVLRNYSTSKVEENVECELMQVEKYVSEWSRCTN